MPTGRETYIDHIPMTISTARPASSVDSTIKPINVLSEPYDNFSESIDGPPNAATRLQQTLEFHSKASVDPKMGSPEIDQTQAQTGYTTSGSSASIRIATTAAREMVAGLFGRRKRSFNSLNDGTILSRSPASSLVAASSIDNSDEEYLYNLPTFGPAPACDPSTSRRKNSKQKVPHISEAEGVGYTTFPQFNPSISASRSPTRQSNKLSLPQSIEGVERGGYLFSPLTLTQSRCDRTMNVTRAGNKATTPSPRVNMQKVFKDETQVPTIPPKIRLTSSPSDRPKSQIQNRPNRNDLRFSAGMLIRQNSVCSSVSSVNDTVVTTLYREMPAAGSGAAALTSVLTSPQFGHRDKVTSHTAPESYKLPEGDGYVSFPPYVPGSYFSSSLANLFGRNSSSASLQLEFNSSHNKGQEVPTKPRLRRTLRGLASHKRNDSTSTQYTTQEEQDEGMTKQ